MALKKLAWSTSVEIPGEPSVGVTVAAGLDDDTQIQKTVAQLTEAELGRIKDMGIDIEDVDYVTITKHAFFVATGANQWQQKRLGTKPVSEAEMRLLKAEYNKLSAELRAMEANMTEEDMPAATALMEKIGSVYEAIVRGGYAISTEESTQGFQGIETFEADMVETSEVEPRPEAPEVEQKREFPVLF